MDNDVKALPKYAAELGTVFAEVNQFLSGFISHNKILEYESSRGEGRIHTPPYIAYTTIKFTER